MLPMIKLLLLICILKTQIGRKKVRFCQIGETEIGRKKKNGN